MVNMPIQDRFTHFVKGLSGVEGRGSPPGLGSSILLQPLRNHDAPEHALNLDPTPLRLILEPAELMAVILDLEGCQLSHSEGAGSFAFLSLRCLANQGLRSSLTSSDRETFGSRPFASRSRLLTSSVVLRAVQVFIFAFIAVVGYNQLSYKPDWLFMDPDLRSLLWLFAAPTVGILAFASMSLGPITAYSFWIGLTTS